MPNLNNPYLRAIVVGHIGNLKEHISGLTLFTERGYFISNFQVSNLLGCLLYPNLPYGYLDPLDI